MSFIYKMIEHIDSNNANEFEQVILEAFDKNGDLVLDASDLKYISSAGLRVLLKLIKKQAGKLEIFNVSNEVHEILDTTGFTEMMDVKKAFRNVSVEGCPIIGQGGNGTVYKLSPEQIVKVYREDIPFSKLSEEKDFAKKSFVAGVPTAIAFDIVKVGNCYGTVYELMDSNTLSNAFVSNPDKFDELVDKYVELVRNLGNTDVSSIGLDAVKDSVVKEITRLEKYLDPEDFKMIIDIANSIADGKCFVHGDLHPGNIMLQSNGELMLIDMADVKMGPHTYDLVSIYRDLLQAPSDKNENIRERNAKSVGMSPELSIKIFNAFIRKYLGTDDEATIQKYVGTLGLISCISALAGFSHTGDELITKMMPMMKASLIDAVIKPNYQAMKYILSTMK